MTICSATVYTYLRRLRGQKRKGLFLKLEGKNGQKSWGEIAPLALFSDESYEQAAGQLLKQLPSLLLNRCDLTSLFPSVHFGIESALLDFHIPNPFYPIPVQALLAGSPEEMLVKARYVTCYRAVKIKVGHLAIEESIPLVKKLLPFLSGKIRIDANQKWSYDQGMAFARSFPRDTFDYFEEPFTKIKDYLAFPYPIALDETSRSSQLAHFFDLPQLKALILKPMLIGGLAKLVPLLQKARQKKISCIFSSSYETDLGIALIAKMANRLHLPKIPMGLDTYSSFRDQPFFQKITCTKGTLYFPQTWALCTPSRIAHEYV